jgi:hypothetical protein
MRCDPRLSVNHLPRTDLAGSLRRSFPPRVGQQGAIILSNSERGRTWMFGDFCLPK